MNKVGCLVILAVIVAWSLGIGWLFQVGFNAIVVPITGWAWLGYWKAVALMFFISLFFNSFI